MARELETRAIDMVERRRVFFFFDMDMSVSIVEALWVRAAPALSALQAMKTKHMQVSVIKTTSKQHAVMIEGTAARTA